MNRSATDLILETGDVWCIIRHVMLTAVEDIILWPPKRNKISYNRSLFSLFLGCLYYAALACAWIVKRMDSHGHKCFLDSELFSTEVELS